MKKWKRRQSAPKAERALIVHIGRALTRKDILSKKAPLTICSGRHYFGPMEQSPPFWVGIVRGSPARHSPPVVASDS